MACDINALIADSKCVICNITPGMIPILQLTALCNLAGGAGGTGPYVLKTGDTMTGTLIISGTGTFLQTNFVWANLADTGNNTQPVTLELYHDTTGGGGAVNAGVSLDFRADSATVDRQLQARITSLWNNATDATRTSELRFSPVINGTTTECMRLTTTLIDARNGTFYGVAGTQVVSGRKTGWGAPTGVATRTTFDPSTVTLSQLGERVKALIDDLTSHGLIGA